MSDQTFGKSARDHWDDLERAAEQRRYRSMSDRLWDYYLADHERSEEIETAVAKLERATTLAQIIKAQSTVELLLTEIED